MSVESQDLFLSSTCYFSVYSNCNYCLLCVLTCLCPKEKTVCTIIMIIPSTFFLHNNTLLLCFQLNGMSQQERRVSARIIILLSLMTCLFTPSLYQKLRWNSTLVTQLHARWVMDLLSSAYLCKRVERLVHITSVCAQMLHRNPDGSSSCSPQERCVVTLQCIYGYYLLIRCKAQKSRGTGTGTLKTLPCVPEHC